MFFGTPCSRSRFIFRFSSSISKIILHSVTVVVVVVILHSVSVVAVVDLYLAFAAV